LHPGSFFWCWRYATRSRCPVMWGMHPTVPVTEVLLLPLLTARFAGNMPYGLRQTTTGCRAIAPIWDRKRRNKVQLVSPLTRTKNAKRCLRVPRIVALRWRRHSHSPSALPTFGEAKSSGRLQNQRPCCSLELGSTEDRAGVGTKNAKRCLRVPNGLCVIRRMNGFGWSDEVAIVARDKETICVHVREPVVTAAH